MSQHEERLWVAFVVGVATSKKQMIASFLTFNARNKHQALIELKKALPQHPNWVDDAGGLIAFNIFALHQCKLSEVDHYAHAYVNAFAETMGEEPQLEGVFFHP